MQWPRNHAIKYNKKKNTPGSDIPPGDNRIALIISFQGFGNGPHLYSFIKTVYQCAVSCKSRVSSRQCYWLIL